MNVEVSITTTDTISGPLREKIAAMQPARIAKVVGPRVNELTRGHLVANGTNQRGWPSTGFWEDAARATGWKDMGDGSVLISIAKIGVRQRYRGGAIVPKNVKFLTIPIHPDAYGKTAKDFDNLILITTPKGAYLAQGSFESLGLTKDGRRTRRGRGSPIKRQVLTFLFKLSSGVDQVANPNVIPSPADYTRAALTALDQAVTTIVKGGKV